MRRVGVHRGGEPSALGRGQGRPDAPRAVGAVPRFLGPVVLLNVLGCRLTYYGQAETNAEAWFNIALCPRKPEGSLGQTA